MAKNQDTPQVAEDQQISLSIDQLKEILQTAKNAQQTKHDSTLKELVNAIVESRKPYEDPLRAENERMFRENDRRSLNAQRENLRRAQDSCPHVKGLGGQEPGSASAFWIHTTDTGETIGICSYCQKVISSLIPEDGKYFAMKGSNSPSAAGKRSFWDPLGAQVARFGHDDREKIKSNHLGKR
jgi:hypothetical protein